MAAPAHNSQGRPNFSSFTLTAMLAAETATGIPALAMLKQTCLLPNPPSGLKILDNACGSGVVAKRLFENLPSSGNEDFELVCGDLDMTMVNMTSELMASKGWGNVHVQQVDAQSTGFPDGEFSHVLMNFGPQLMSDAIAALRETHRVLKSGGITGFTSWVRAGWLPSIVAVFPEFKPPGLLKTDSWKDSGSIENVLREVGFVEVQVKEEDFITEFAEVDGFLELMGLLMPGLLNGENMRRYERYMREEVKKGPVEMSWQALVVSARKS